jgi:hypothetical protein
MFLRRGVGVRVRNVQGVGYFFPVALAEFLRANHEAVVFVV